MMIIVIFLSVSLMWMTPFSTPFTIFPIRFISISYDSFLTWGNYRRGRAVPTSIYVLNTSGLLIQFLVLMFTQVKLLTLFVRGLRVLQYSEHRYYVYCPLGFVTDCRWRCVGLVVSGWLMDHVLMITMLLTSSNFGLIFWSLYLNHFRLSLNCQQ